VARTFNLFIVIVCDVEGVEADDEDDDELIC
jgi:hypothetical protein